MNCGRFHSDLQISIKPQNTLSSIYFPFSVNCNHKFYQQITSLNRNCFTLIFDIGSPNIIQAEQNKNMLPFILFIILYIIFIVFIVRLHSSGTLGAPQFQFTRRFFLVLALCFFFCFTASFLLFMHQPASRDLFWKLLLFACHNFRIFTSRFFRYIVRNVGRTFWVKCFIWETSFVN